MPDLKAISSREVIPGYSAKFVHGDQSTLAFWDVSKGSVMPPHRHPHEQITYIAEGTLEMMIGQELYTFTKGMCHVIPPHTTHSAVALEDCRIIDAFSPARDDYR